MSATTTIRISLPGELAEHLDELARRTERDREAVVADAIEAFLEEEDWHAEAIASAAAKADAGGQFVSHEDAKDYLEVLARGERPDRPRTFMLKR